MSLPEGERLFTQEQIADLLAKAQALGFSLEPGSELERMTVLELEHLVNTRH